MKVFKNLLVPIDYSEETVDMLKYLAVFASKFNSEITLLHTIKLSYLAKYSRNIPTFISLEKHMNGDVFKKIKESYYNTRVKPMFNSAIEILKEFGIPRDRIEIKVREGYPSEEIVKEAKGGRYSCMFIKRGRDEGKIAKTTEKVVKKCYSIPIFVFGYRGIESGGVKNILVPFNGTKHSLEAVKVANLVAEAFGSKTSLLYVGENKDVFKGIDKYIDSEHIVRRGEVSKEIIKEALTGDYDLIVIGRRCPSLKKTLLGSISESIVKNIEEIPICLVTYCSL